MVKSINATSNAVIPVLVTGIHASKPELVLNCHFEDMGEEWIPVTNTGMTEGWE